MKKSRFKEIVKEVLVEDNEYQVFFQKCLDKAGKSIPEMGEQEKRDFFNKIDSAWKGRGEKKNEDLVGNQTKLDVDKDGDIEADDLAKLRGESKSPLNEIDLGWITIFINIFALMFYYTLGNKFSAKEWFQIIKGNIKDVYRDRELQQIMSKLSKDQEFMKYVRGEMKGPRGGAQSGKAYTEALKQRLSKEEMKYIWSFGQSVMKNYSKANKQESVINENEFTNQTGIKSSLARSSEFQKSVGDSKVIRWVLDKSVKLFNWVNHGLIFTDSKQEMIVQGGKPFKVLVPLQPARNQFKSLYNNDKYEGVTPQKKDFTYDYMDIGQFSVPENKWNGYTDDQFMKMGKKIVDTKFKGDIGKAYDTIVRNKKHESINEDAKKVWKYKGVLLVDSDFVNFCKGKLPNSELKHAGGGDFFLQTPDGMISFDRTNGSLEGMSGRAHQVSDNQGGKLLALLIKKMGAKIVNESVNEGRKRFYQQDGIGKSKYTISKHDGKTKHKDGSDFYDIKIFKNKQDLENYKQELLHNGYKEDSGFKTESINEKGSFVTPSGLVHKYFNDVNTTDKWKKLQNDPNYKSLDSAGKKEVELLWKKRSSKNESINEAWKKYQLIPFDSKAEADKRIKLNKDKYKNKVRNFKTDKNTNDKWIVTFERLDESINEDKLKDLENALKSHDWYYDRSDDHSKYKHGLEQRNKIIDLKKDLEKNGQGTEAQKLWNKYKKM